MKDRRTTSLDPREKVKLGNYGVFMNFSIRISIQFLLLFALSISCSQTCYAQKRVALLIGNADYENGKLANPENDVDLLESSLVNLNFHVTKLKNQNRREMLDAVDKIVKELGKDDICMFFYAGHGIQVKGVNYLVPVKASVKTDA